MPCVGHGFVTGYAFLGHQIGQGAAQSRGAVLVMYVHHDAIIRAFAYGVMQPDGPELVAHLYETELDAFDAPFFIKGKYVV